MHLKKDGTYLSITEKLGSLFLCFSVIYLMVLAKSRDNIRKLSKHCLRCDLSVYLLQYEVELADIHCIITHA